MADAGWKRVGDEERTPAQAEGVGWPRFAYAWGSTAAERASAFACDEVLPGGDCVCFRAVSVQAPPAVLFRWLCQLRAAPYSYDWIDNGGRRSPQQLTPGLDVLAAGQPVMRIFDLVSFEHGRHLTCRLRRPGLIPPLAVTYRVDSGGASPCRLVVKLAMRSRGTLRDRLALALLPALDWIMMRRQLLELKRLAEWTAAAASG